MKTYSPGELYRSLTQLGVDQTVETGMFSKLTPGLDVPRSTAKLSGGKIALPVKYFDGEIKDEVWYAFTADYFTPYDYYGSSPMAGGEEFITIDHDLGFDRIAMLDIQGGWVYSGWRMDFKVVEQSASKTKILVRSAEVAGGSPRFPRPQYNWKCQIQGWGIKIGR